MIVFAAIMPHPPESIPGIGTADNKKAIKKTLKAFERLRSDLERADPNLLIVISPHGHLEPYAFSVNSASQLVGSFENFGSDQVYGYENDVSFANKLAFAGSMNEFPTYLHEEFLDHGALIPLYHLIENINPKIIHLSFSLMDYDSHYRWGQLIQNLISGGQRVAVVASADLSHKLLPISFAGFSPGAQKFDRDILHYLGSNDEASILGLQPSAALEAAECGMRSIVVLLGILHGIEHKFELLSYEYPFGIGYMTARLV